MSESSREEEAPDLDREQAVDAPTTSHSDRWITATEIMERYGVGRPKVQQVVKSGMFPAIVRTGSSYTHILMPESLADSVFGAEGMASRNKRFRARNETTLSRSSEIEAT